MTRVALIAAALILAALAVIDGPADHYPVSAGALPWLPQEIDR